MRRRPNTVHSDCFSRSRAIDGRFHPASPQATDERAGEAARAGSCRRGIRTGQHAPVEDHRVAARAGAATERAALSGARPADVRRPEGRCRRTDPALPREADGSHHRVRAASNPAAPCRGTGRRRADGEGWGGQEFRPGAGCAAGADDATLRERSARGFPFGRRRCDGRREAAASRAEHAAPRTTPTVPAGSSSRAAPTRRGTFRARRRRGISAGSIARRPSAGGRTEHTSTRGRQAGRGFCR